MFDAHVRQISKHVYGMKAGKPDRPSLCAVVGTRQYPGNRVGDYSPGATPESRGEPVPCALA